MKRAASLRTRTLTIAQSDMAGIDELLPALRSLEGVNEVRIEPPCLTIGYAFPETGLDIILATIAKFAAGTAAQFRACMAAGMERLEREHLQSARGWDVYTRDIYVALHQRELERRSRQPRKNWQQSKH